MSATTDPPAASSPFTEMIRNPAACTYLLIAAVGLVAMVLVYGLFLQNLVASAVVLLIGVTGLTLRWVVGPPAIVVIVCYFSFFPNGLPFFQGGDQFLDRQTEMNTLLTALMLNVSAMVYLLATFRFFAIMRAGMPFDAPTTFVKPGAKPTVRPAVPVREAELLFIFARVGVAVLAGQLLWLMATKLKLDFRNGFPLRTFNSPLEASGYAIDVGGMSNSLSRFMIVAGSVLAISFVIWLVFWYWRLSSMNRDEARAACLDMEWTTNRREFSRPERWRGMMKRRLLGTRTKQGCGPWFLALGLVVLLPSMLFAAAFFLFGWNR